MPRPLLNIVLDLNEIAKQNQTGPIRFSLCLLTVLLQLLDQKMPIARICRRLAIGRTSAYWAITKGRRILDWVAQEANAEPVWAPCPCFNPAAHWSDFVRMFAMQFYPKRYGPPLTNRT